MFESGFTPYPLYFVFSSYTIIGLTLLIINASIAIYFSRLKLKTKLTKTLIIFYIFVSLSGISTILANSIVHWQRVFLPWQDFWIIAGGVALTYFAYLVPKREKSGEAKFMVIVLSSIALIAFIYCIIYSYFFLFDWKPTLITSDLYYLLLPISISIGIFIFLRNSWLLFRIRQPDVERVSLRTIWKKFILTKDEDVKVLLFFGLALILAFLPGLQTLLKFSNPTGFILSNIGSILAIIAISLIYLNYAPEINSFLAKLVGITLASVLLIFSIFGTLDIYFENNQFISGRDDLTIALYDTLTENNGELFAAPPLIDYIVSWEADTPEDESAYQLIFKSNDVDFSLDSLIEDNQEGRLNSATQILSGDLVQETNHLWTRVERFWQYPPGSTHEDYKGYLFTDQSRTYEIGFSSFAAYDFVSGVVSMWLVLMISSSVFILIVFPKFFRYVLVQPIRKLLKGVQQV